MFDKTKNPRGESLLETIIAFTILGVGIAFASVAMSSSLRNIDNSKNRIIAVNAAREGIEAMRNIRDTNWLKYSTKRRECWNHLPPKDPSVGCATPKPIEPGNYIIYKQGEYSATKPSSYRWRIFQISQTESNASGEILPKNPTGNIFYNTKDKISYGLDGKNWVDIRTLYNVDIDTTKDSDGDKKNDKDIYNHIFTTGKDTLGANPVKTGLKREIIIEYLRNDGTPLTSSSVTSDYNRMRVTSKVTWKKGEKEFTVELKTHLTDYLGRDKLSG